MISSEVQRTLVKSPPELWAEISDPESLARHLGEFGEIRITRVQPEQKVEWEAEQASGSIVIKPSGWGTKVRLTVQRELSGTDTGLGSDEAVDEAEAAAPELTAAIELEAPIELETEPEPGTETELEAEAEAEADTVLEADEPAAAEVDEPADTPLAPAQDDAPPRRLGFWARLFGRRRAARSAEVADADIDAPTDFDAPSADLHAPRDFDAPAEDDDEPSSVEPSLAEEGIASAEPVPAEAQPAEAKPPEAPAPAAELERAEEHAEEQVTAVLTGVLDRLGAAHHRPFSRA